MKGIYRIGCVSLLLLMMGCQKEEDEVSNETQHAITFNSELEDEYVATRATYGLYNYHTTIKVNGVKIKNSNEEKVMSGYGIQYLDNKACWEYVTGRQNTFTNQIEKYWDYDATEYRFIAGSPYNMTTINSSTSLTLDALKMQSTLSKASTIATGYLFSQPEKVTTTDYNKTVMMTFRIAMSRVLVAFYYAEPQADAISLTNITFAPTSGTYAEEGTMQVDYDFSTETYTQTITPSKTSSVALTLQPVDLAVPCTTQTFTSTVYYMLPISSSATPVPWELTVGSLLENNTAIVPAEYMNWQPGMQYVYVFKLSSTKTDTTIKYIKCIQTAITDWDTGESNNAEVYNW